MLALPTLTNSVLVAEPPERVPGAWAGGPSVVRHEGWIYLAYRLRRPVGEGRGYRNVVARSRDGLRFEPVCALDREAFGADSLERPCLVVTPDGRWRLYVSCATPGTKHWRVDLLESATAAGLATAAHRTVLPGSATTGVKDPVIVHDRDLWHLWASVHPLESWDDADRMTTDYATSTDGVAWSWHGTVLRGTPGSWDARGVRVSSVSLSPDRVIATYDGRADASQNWEEVTGVAVALRDRDGRCAEFTPIDREPLRWPASSGGLRYLAVLPQGEDLQWYYEVSRADGAHELRTERVRVDSAAGADVLGAASR